MTEPARELGTLEEAKEAITARGRERGFVTSEDLLETVPVEDFTPEQVEEFLTHMEEHLRTEGIDIIEVPGEEDTATLVRNEVDLLKAPTNDPVRMYLKEIGKVPLLNAAQEVDLARRIEAGEFSTALQRFLMVEEKVDQKQLKLVVERVWEIRNHQLTAFGKVEGVGRDKIAKTFRPKDRVTLEDWLHRVERDGQLAKRKLIEANLRLVVSIAKRYVGRGMLFLDLIQEGNLGLIRAVEKFDYRLGFKLSTYATWWIRQSITRALADQGRTIRLPVHVAEQVRRSQRARRQLAQRLNRDPSVEEIATESGLTPERVQELFELVTEPVSLETPVGDGESMYADLIEDERSESPDAQTANLARAVELASALEELEPRMRHVLERRFGLDGELPQTLEDLGSDLGITRERVRQIETRALRQLRNLAPGLQAYLTS